MINIPLCSSLLYTVSSVYACINNTNKFNPQLCVLQLMACDFLEAQHMIVYFSSFVNSALVSNIFSHYKITHWLQILQRKDVTQNV